MKDLSSFISQNMWLVILIFSIACIILGKIWSDNLNWGEITEPTLIIRSGKKYQILNLYKGEPGAENWNVGSIVCFKTYHHRFFEKYAREIYVSGDKIRFDDDGPGIGLVYQAVLPKTANGFIRMKPVIIAN